MLIFDKAKNILNEEDVNEERLNEYCQTINDRLCLRLGVCSLPERFINIAVDATVKLYRRYYYEGISSEGDGGISTSFVEDVLAEYSTEINSYKKVRFI